MEKFNKTRKATKMEKFNKTGKVIKMSDVNIKNLEHDVFLPPNELVPELSMTAAQLAENRDWGHVPLEIEACHLLADGEGIKVAVLDTGIQENHPDLVGRVVARIDFTNSPSGPHGVQGHGTHCAGIIGASKNDNGIIGVAPKVQLYNVKVLGDNGSGSSAGVARGINWAVDQKVDIISLSLGSPSPDSASRAAIQRAVNAGIVVICAAGNEGPGSNTVGYPGGYDESECVAAVDNALRVANFSSRGVQVDISAPGVAILSTYTGGQYATLSGTSMATPYVSGCVALYLSYLKKNGIKFPPVSQIIDLIHKTAKKIGTPTSSYGNGLIQPLAMIKSVTVTPVPPVPPVPPVTPPVDFVDVSSPELVAKGVTKIRVEFKKV